MTCRCRHVYDKRTGEAVRGTGSPADPYVHEVPRVSCMRSRDGLITSDTERCLKLPHYIESVAIDRPIAQGGPLRLTQTDDGALLMNTKPLNELSFCGIDSSHEGLNEINCIDFKTPQRYYIDVRSIGDPEAPIDINRKAKRNRLSLPSQDVPYFDHQGDSDTSDGMGALTLPQFTRDAFFINKMAQSIPDFPGSEIRLMSPDRKLFFVNRVTTVLATITFSISTNTVPQLLSDSWVTGAYKDAYTPTYVVNNLGGGKYQPDYDLDYITPEEENPPELEGGPFLTEESDSELAQEDGALLFQEETPYVYPPIEDKLYWNFLLQRVDPVQGPIRVGFGSQSISEPATNETWYTYYDSFVLDPSNTTPPSIEYRLKTDKIYTGLNVDYFFEFNWAQVHFQFM